MANKAKKQIQEYKPPSSAKYRLVFDLCQEEMDFLYCLTGGAICGNLEGPRGLTDKIYEATRQYRSERAEPCRGVKSMIEMPESFEEMYANCRRSPYIDHGEIYLEDPGDPGPYIDEPF